jgi:hypothetical protein
MSSRVRTKVLYAGEEFGSQEELGPRLKKDYAIARLAHDHVLGVPQIDS